VPRSCVLHLKVRLLKGVKTELRAAKESGLTWLVIWEAMKEIGYPGAYPNFCRTAKALLYGGNKGKHENLPAPRRTMPAPASIPVATDRNSSREEKPEWQRKRQEIKARLDQEAEQNREREARLSRTKPFNPPPFVGREG